MTVAEVRVYIRAPGELVVSGVLSFDTVPQAYEQGIALLGKASTWRVCLENVSFGDSSALVLMVGWCRVLLKDKATIVFNKVPVFLQDLLKVYHLDGVVVWTSI